MTDWQSKTPVAFLIFNRPDTTEKVFEAIRQAKPPKLLVVADGPRADKPGEAEKCAAARAIIDRVDWDCEVIKNYADANMGCKRRVSSGLDWVFETVEAAIILEDDCLPHPTFFRFSDELLEKYRDDQRIMAISGTNTLEEWKSNIQSYHFAYFGMIWGWASWRRAWSYYDVEMKLWAEPEMKHRIRDILGNDQQYNRVKQAFDGIYKGQDTWDFQWFFARVSQSGLSVIPSVNLISNIGFTAEGTHTTAPTEGISNLSLGSMSFPLRSPYGVGIDREYSQRHNQKFMPKSLPQRIVGKIKRIFRGK
ncbi:MULTISPECIES: hemolytic protein HlpA-like protein [Planktothricoides]|uniref:Glycosyltransferase family 2 protein n=1 Tax=Planktothricoides raciborskii FACHB-1370 TaxID=2949576 RepID=A0ABR8E779_9CYAN|nr:MULTISPECIES: hemolytic protein HlpA-like protein [Planktothricoides]KOR38100.1 hemolytic protein HlpA-like protein [Planktothricoides sp. SR001]MBD2542553.1 glycosyltransferase family 2 protein [Planktothricoides raciborskii FACHB-1370]MBD2581010.1 glycosyltransferase family 2 protein [Planktothricoides raciborskii FACHB-1261]